MPDLTMKCVERVVASVGVALLLAIMTPNLGLASSSRSVSVVVERVRRLYAEINKTASAKRAPDAVFYTDEDGYAARRWKKAASKASREAANRGHFTATVYKIDNRVAKVIFRIDSRSGDWVNTTEYYFYPDGKAAFRFESHFTYLGPDVDIKGASASGPYLVERRRYFDARGHVVRDIDRAFVVSSKQQVALDYVQHVDVDAYSSVSELPFARLLGQGSARCANGHSGASESPGSPDQSPDRE